MDEQASIGQVKRDISELVNRVAYGGERIVLTSRGKPKAALVSIDDYKKLQQTQNDDRVYIKKMKSDKSVASRFSKLRGTATVKMTTEEIMALTRSTT